MQKSGFFLKIETSIERKFFHKLPSIPRLLTSTLMSNSRLKELGGTEGDFLTSVHEDTVTFRYYVDPLLKHEDGKLGICFNVAFRGQSRDIATPLTVANNEVNSRYQIVSKRAVDECEALIDRCNSRLKRTDLSATNLTILDIMRLLA